MLFKCLECGKYYRRPMSHVWQVHDMSAREYKEKHGFDVKKGIVSEEYRTIMREHVMTNGTVNNLKKGKKFWFKKGVTNNYTRSKQTQERLKEHWKKVAKRTGRIPVPKIEIHCAECGKLKMIYPRAKRIKNYCGVVCRNRAINNKKTN